MNIIADTNVWYGIGSNNIDVTTIRKESEDILCATPINILEIISNVSNHQFEKRKRAMTAILQYSDRILDDTETYLTNLWGNPIVPNDIRWYDILLAVNSARDLNDLRNGVFDNLNKLIRKVNVDLSHFWRISMWEDFRIEIEKTIDRNILPGYRNTRKKGKIIHLKKKEGAELRTNLFSDIFQNEILNATFDRANLVLQDYNKQLDARDREHSINTNVRQIAFRNLSPYTQAYAQYLYKCSTEYAPEDNDWGDLEQFTYLQGENRLLTFEKKWNDIAKDTGNERWLYSYDA